MTSSVPPNTQLIEIEYTDGSRTAARRGVQELSAAYLAYRESKSQAVVDRQLHDLTEQRQDATAKLEHATQSGKRKADAASSARTQVYVSQLAQIDDAIATARATDTDPGSIVSPASTPQRTTPVEPWMAGAVAGLLGLAVATGLVLLRERRFQRRRGGDESDVLGIPMLAVVSAEDHQGRRVSADPTSPVSEAYRKAKAGIVASSVSNRTVLSIAGVGQTMVSDVALNLGLALSRAHYATIVVDATAGNGTVAQTLDDDALAPPCGLADMLRGHASLTPRTVMGMDVLSAGSDPRGVLDLYHSEAMKRIVGQLQLQYDFTVLATTDVRESVGCGVAMESDALILVVEEGELAKPPLTEALDRCREVGVTVLGLVQVPKDGGLPREDPHRPGSQDEVQETQPSHLTQKKRHSVEAL